MIERIESLEYIVISNDYPLKRKKKLRKMPGECASDSFGELSPSQNYRVNAFRRIYYMIQLMMNECFGKNEKLINVLVYLDPRCFDKIGSKLILKVLKVRQNCRTLKSRI